MLIIGSLIVLLLIGIWLFNVSRLDSGLDILGFACILIGSVGSCAVLVSLILSPLHIHGKIAEFEAARTTIAHERAIDSRVLESATGRADVIELNRWIASTQFYNDTIFDLWIPDEIYDVEPIL